MNSCYVNIDENMRGGRFWVTKILKKSEFTQKSKMLLKKKQEITQKSKNYSKKYWNKPAAEAASADPPLMKLHQ